MPNRLDPKVMSRAERLQEAASMTWEASRKDERLCVTSPTSLLPARGWSENAMAGVRGHRICWRL